MLILTVQFSDMDQLIVVLVIHEALIEDLPSVLLLYPRPSLPANIAESLLLSPFRRVDWGSWLLVQVASS